MTSGKSRLLSEWLKWNPDAQPINTGILGNTPTMWIDDLASHTSDYFRVPEDTVVYNNAKWPEADVRVQKRWRDARDPLNPRPQAGKVPVWVVIAGGREKVYQTGVLARMQGKALHERLVAKLEEQRAEEMARTTNHALYGRF